MSSTWVLAILCLDGMLFYIFKDRYFYSLRLSPASYYLNLVFPGPGRVPPPTQPPPPPPGPNAGGITPASTFRPAAQAKLYASPKDLESVAYRPSRTDSHAVSIVYLFLMINSWMHSLLYLLWLASADNFTFSKDHKPSRTGSHAVWLLNLFWW